MTARKWCFVPSCKNTTHRTPEKIFLTVPKDSEKRRKWFSAARRDIREVSEKSTLYCCEDHFKLEEDLNNFMEYKLSKVRPQLKPNILPHLFACQPDKKPNKRARESSEKRARKRAILELMYNTEDTHIEYENANVAGQNEMDESIQIFPSTSGCRRRETACQTKKVQFRSRAIQVNLKPYKIDQSTSPLKIATNEPPRKVLQLDSESEQTKRRIFQKESSEEYQPTEASSSEATSTEKQIEGKQFELLFMKIVERKLRMYTGIPQIYNDFVKIVERNTSLTKRHIYIVLYKIKTNDSYAKIGDLFGVSKASASRIFSQGVLTLGDYFKKLIFWPSKHSIQANLPIQFRVLFCKVQSIIDCLEIEIQKPSSALQQSLTWSDYKKCNTLKYLISATPDGLINFVSCGYGGRVSDATLLEDCGYLDVLPTNCVVMADRGFKQIESLLNKNNCTLVRPPSVSGEKKMTEDEVILTKRIASVRIHIERIIKRIRDFKLLSPHATVNSELVQKMDSVIIIACAIINLQKPIINR